MEIKDFLRHLSITKHSILSLLVYWISFVIMFDTFFISWKEISSFTSTEFKVYLFLIMSSLALFVFIRFKIFFYVPSSDKIRILIGISSENLEQRERIKKDLIEKVQLISNVENAEFDFFHLPEGLEYNINNAVDKVKYIKKINRRLKAHLYIYGSMKERGSDGEKKYFIDLGYALLHPELNHRQQERLQLNLNFSSFEHKFSTNYETEGFEITTKETYFIARYFLGIAIVLAGFTKSAFDIHKQLFTEKDTIDSLPNKDFFISELKLILMEESSQLSHYYLFNDELEKSLYFTREIGLLGNKGGEFLHMAIYEYKKGELDKAFIYIRRAQKELSSRQRIEWRFSKAYLLLISKDYFNFLKELTLIKQGLNNYRVIGISYNKTFYEDMIAFAEKDYQSTNNQDLMFWIGAIYYLGLANIPKTYGVFNDFLNHIENNHELYNEAEEYFKIAKNKILHVK